MIQKVFYIFITLFLAFLFISTKSLCWAQTTPIGITQISDLSFGISAPGDPQMIISPGTSETPQNASFLITGEALTSYSISLPRSIFMTLIGGNTKIKVDQFTSFPAEGGNGLLDGSGKQYLYVGARRAALNNNTVSGNYVGTFSVDVVY